MVADEKTLLNIAGGWTSIVDIFEDHARRTPNALAVEAQGLRRNYAELTAQTDRFAGCLAVWLGDGNRTVGICLDRDVDLPAWLLAILKVGAAYVPIDPTLPPARVSHLLEDARPSVIVASRRYAETFVADAIPVKIAEDEHASPPFGPIVLTPQTLAYVIFTSGSTGRPKGVEIEHGALIALLAAMADSPGLCPGEKMLGLTRISFDLSVPDMFLPFFVGGSLALVTLEVAGDPHRLAAAFDDYRPDLVQGTPSTWRALIEGGWQGYPTLRLVAGGEAVTRALADALLPRCAQLWNMYGPTEATVWATSYQVSPGTAAIPIGRPIKGAVIDVVDQENESVPVGTVGEILIGGAGIARGYRQLPDLTRERFVTRAGKRAYRTGDLGWIDETGTVYCLGRLDDQVKVRGFRIELGDIEAALALHPAVAWCASRVWTDQTDESVLIAYLVPKQGMSPTSRELKTFLNTQVAPYMVPDRIVMIPAMPLTANGKVDRVALPDPFSADKLEINARDLSTDHDRLAAIWGELLGRTDITNDDDFFDLGGYSLMTVRLARRIAADFGVTLALVDLLQHSTLDAMVKRIVEGATTPTSPTMLLNQAGTRPPLFWLDAGPLMRTMTRGLSPDQPAFALNLDATDEAALQDGNLSIAAVAARLRMHLVAHQPLGPYYLGGWCRWGIVAFELAQQLTQAGATIGLLILLDAERPGWSRLKIGLRRRVANWLGLREPKVFDGPPSLSQRVEAAAHSYVANCYPANMLLLRPAAGLGDGGWAPVIGGQLSIERIAGNHISMVREDAGRQLARTIDDALLAAQQACCTLTRKTMAE